MSMGPAAFRALSRLHAPSAEQFYLMVCEYTTNNVKPQSRASCKAGFSQIGSFKASELCTLITGISRVRWKGDGPTGGDTAALVRVAGHCFLSPLDSQNPGQLPQACRQMFQKCAGEFRPSPSLSMISFLSEYVSASPFPTSGDATPQGADKGVCFSDKQVRIFVTALAKV